MKKDKNSILSLNAVLLQCCIARLEPVAG